MPRLRRMLSFSHGFTLIEVLITISIISIIAAVVLPNLRNFNQTEGLNIAKASLFDDLRLAKSKADTGTVCPGSPLNISSLQIVYSVELRKTGYYLKYQCINDTSTPPIYYPTPNPAPFKPYPVSTNVTMADIRQSNNNSMFCNISNGTDYATITFKSKNCPAGTVCAATDISCTKGSITDVYNSSFPASLKLINAALDNRIISISPGGSIYEN